MKKARLLAILCVGAAAFFAFGPAGAGESDAPRRTGGAGAWTALGPAGGDISSIVRNPKAPSELYAATRSGLIFQSGNNGGSWTRKAVIEDTLCDLAIDPKTPSTLYALSGTSIYKSVNKGAAFVKTALGDEAYANLGRIAVDPSNPRIIYIVGAMYHDAASRKSCLAVLKSVNGGRSWTAKALDPTSEWAYGLDIAVSHKNPSLVFACGYYGPASGGGYKAAIFRSANGGGAWKNVTPAFMNAEAYRAASAVAVDPTNAAKAYVAYTDGVARTSDGGASWKKRVSPSWMYCHTVAVDATAPDTLYAGGFRRLYKSTDGGKNWTEFPLRFYGSASRWLVRGKTLHVATDGGIFKSANGGALFASGHAGLLAADIKSFVHLPAGSGSLSAGAGTFYAAAGRYGIFKSESGSAWTKLDDFAGSDAVAHIVGPRSDPLRIYVSTEGSANPRAYGSVDGGRVFKPLLPGAGCEGLRLLAYPADPDRLLAAGYIESGGKPCMGVFLSNDAGTSWTRVRLMNESGSEADAAALAPSNVKVLYVAGHGADWKPVLFRSTNGGTAWTRIKAPAPAASVTCLAVHPSSQTTLYATTSWQGNFKSTDGGSSWTKLACTASGANCVAVNPSDPNEVFIGSSEGVEYSADGGSTWTDLSADPAVKNVVWIEVDGPARLVYAGIKGGGICRRSY